MTAAVVVLAIIATLTAQPVLEPGPCTDTLEGPGAIIGTDGPDTILCYTGATRSIHGAAGNDRIELHTGTYEAVRGDVGTGFGGGADTIILHASATATHIAGDNTPEGSSVGDDVIIALGDVIGGPTGIYGDAGRSQFSGGDDTIIVAGRVHPDTANAVVGDGHFGRGGADDILVTSTAVIVGDVKGDGTGGGTDGGPDTIRVDGTVDGVIAGDAVFGNGGADHITIGITAHVERVKGDAADLDGAPDTIILEGRANLVQGDDVFGTGATDHITITGSGRIEQDDDPLSGSLAGDAAFIDGAADLIEIYGYVAKSVAGDAVNRDGAPDTIMVYEGADVGPVVGDSSFPGLLWPGGNGADDLIVIHTGALVRGNVIGDGVVGIGGSDTITINGHVTGSVFGDYAQAGGAADKIVLRGTVDGDIDAGDGDDTIVLAGTVAGRVIAGPGADLISLLPLARVGTVDTIDGEADVITVNPGAVFTLDCDPGLDIIRRPNQPDRYCP